jgi:hypothetical protein
MDTEYAKKVSREATRKGISMNKLFIEAMDVYLQAEQDKAWAASFEAMADDPDATDVSYAIYAQAEVMLGNP